MSDEADVEVVRSGKTAQKWTVTCSCEAELRFTARAVRYSYRGEGLQYGTTGCRVVECPECEHPVVVEGMRDLLEAVAALRSEL